MTRDICLHILETHFAAKPEKLGIKDVYNGIMIPIMLQEKSKLGVYKCNRTLCYITIISGH